MRTIILLVVTNIFLFSNDISISYPSYQTDAFAQTSATSTLDVTEGTVINNKAVILAFDDAMKGQYINAKPILDKNGFKATFFVVCNDIGKGSNFMDWQQVQSLNNAGYDIGSHAMNHLDLAEIPKEEMEFEVGQSKQCLADHGIDAKVFSYPYASGSDDKDIVDTVSRYYELARSGGEPLMFLHCNDGGKEDEANTSMTDCRTYTDEGELTEVNRYSILGWSHDAERKNYLFDDDGMFNRFVEVVNSQSTFNNNGEINAIPIVTYHNIDNREGNYITSVNLFEKEMKYLYDNGFSVYDMSDIGYDETNNYLYIKNTEGN